MVINSQQFHFPSHSAPMFEWIDFSFRPMIKDTIFPVYFYFEVLPFGISVVRWRGVIYQTFDYGWTFAFVSSFFSHVRP